MTNPAGDQSPVAPRSIEQALARGLRLRCPMCGAGRLFRGWFRMHHHCSHCGFVFERAPGYFLGSTYINYGVTAGLTTATYVILRFGWGMSKELLLPAMLVFCVAFPLAFFRLARSLWLALDCCFDPAGAAEAVTRYGDRSNRDSTDANKAD